MLPLPVKVEGVFVGTLAGHIGRASAMGYRSTNV